MNFIEPLLLSLKLSLITMSLLFIVGIPFAYWLVFSRVRWKFLVESVVALPLVLPPTVLGFYLLLIVGGNSFIGRWYEVAFNKTLAFSFEGLVLGSFIYSLPFAVQPFQTAFAGVDRKLLEASWSLGLGLIYILSFLLYCLYPVRVLLRVVCFPLPIPPENSGSCS